MKKFADRLWQLSLVCLVIAVALASLDTFPYWNISYFPDRPSYFFALGGLGLFLASGRWLRGAAQHKTLLLLVLAALFWSTVATVWGSLARKPGHLVFDYLFFFLNWRVWPLLFLLWASLALAACSRKRIVALLSWGFGLLFLQNCVHGLLEILANLGVTDAKTFLMEKNHLFRKEKVAHGWWPPVFFEGRVRGLFAEPCFMGFSLTPLFGYFLFKMQQKKLYIVPIVFLVIMYAFGKTYSGLIEILAFFFFVLIFNQKYRLKTRLLLTCSVAGAGLIFLIGSFFFFKYNDEGKLLFKQFQNMQNVSQYCTLKNNGLQPTPPQLDYTENIQTSVFSRLTAMWLDLDAALHAPFVGTGFFQKGFYWEPLAACNFQQAELGIWVNNIIGSPFREVPQLSEYTTLAAEFGFPGLALFGLLYLYIAVRALRAATRTKDHLLYCLTCAYWAMLVGGLSISFINGVLFFYFSGFLYALSRPRDDVSPQGSRTPQCPGCDPAPS